MAANKEPIRYFVFMKAETTGRPWQDSQQTKIVELSFIAVDRRDLRRGEAKTMLAAQKMNMVLNPERSIQESATDYHNLTDSYVENALTFKHSAAGSIAAFLQQLPKPVCLVAHGGASFDFKLLKIELVEAGCVPEDMLCADSMWIFYHILKLVPEIGRTRSVRLPKLYKILFGETRLATTAEEKVFMLLDCALHRKKAFIEWTAKKCKLLSQVNI